MRQSTRTPPIANLRHMLTVVEAILHSALAREESRGAHYREDHPEEDERWRRNVLARAGDGEMVITTEPVADPSDEVYAALEEAEGVDYHHLE